MTVSVVTSPRVPDSFPSGTHQPPCSSAKPIRLNPKEHGAYAILGVPLVAALLIAV
jgi:hypothetical protein